MKIWTKVIKQDISGSALYRQLDKSERGVVCVIRVAFLGCYLKLWTLTSNGKLEKYVALRRWKENLKMLWEKCLPLSGPMRICYFTNVGHFYFFWIIFLVHGELSAHKVNFHLAMEYINYKSISCTPCSYVHRAKMTLFAHRNYIFLISLRACCYTYFPPFAGQW